MIKTFSKLVLAFSILAGSAQADPYEDARRIVELTVTEELFATMMSTMGSLRAGNIQNEFTKIDKEMSDTAADTLAFMISNEMTKEMVQAMIEPMSEAYVANHSPQALAAYRAFLETPEGQEILALSPAMVSEGAIIGEKVGETVATSGGQRVMLSIQEGIWPPGTPKTVQRELKKLFKD